MADANTTTPNRLNKQEQTLIKAACEYMMVALGRQNAREQNPQIVAIREKTIQDLAAIKIKMVQKEIDL